MHNSWLSLIPPIVALIGALVTRHILISLALGIVSAAFIATDFSLYNTATLTIHKLYLNSDLWRLSSWDAFWHSTNLFVIIFLFILPIIITLIGYSGGSYAYGTWAQRMARSARSTQLSAVALSIILSIDDYFSSLTVGSVMQPLTDRMKIPRIKLSFLVDSLAAPLALICPVSSWIAGIIGFFADNGIGLTGKDILIKADPFSVYIYTAPFFFYSIIILLSTVFIIVYNISFGPMYYHEQIAHTSGNLFGGRKPITAATSDTPEENRITAQIRDFIVPIATLIVTIVCSMLYFGGLFTTTTSVFAAMQQTQAPQALFIGGLLSLIITTLFFFIRKKLTLPILPSLYYQGIQLMAPTVIMLILAWSFGDILREDLHTGAYISSLITYVQLPLSLLPALFFFIAFATALAIGSSWATMAIMLPLALPLIASATHATTPLLLFDTALLLPTIGAVLSGAVAGNHISPLADTTVMSATSSGAYFSDHVYAQAIYALPIIISTGIGFLVAGMLASHGMLISALAGITVGTCISYSSLLFAHRLWMASSSQY